MRLAPLALALFPSSARAEPPSAVGSAPFLELSLSGNIGFGAPAGLASVMARVDINRSVFLELDLGSGIAGHEYGGGVGVTLLQERSKTARLGWASARLTGSLLVTRSRTTDRDAGIPGAPWPELVQGAGTYTWGYAMTGGDIKLDSHLYLLAEVGLAMRLAREADYPMDPTPDDLVSATIRAGVGVTF